MSIYCHVSLSLAMQKPQLLMAGDISHHTQCWTELGRRLHKSHCKSKWTRKERGTIKECNGQGGVPECGDWESHCFYLPPYQPEHHPWCSALHPWSLSSYLLGTAQVDSMKVLFWDPAVVAVGVANPLDLVLKPASVCCICGQPIE